MRFGLNLRLAPTYSNPLMPERSGFGLLACRDYRPNTPCFLAPHLLKQLSTSCVMR